MNNLSWLLYWSDVLVNISRLLGFFALIGSIFSAICVIIYITRCFGDWDYEPENYNRLKRSPYFLLLSSFLALLAMLIPSKETFYLITASEMGEQATHTQEFNKLRQVVNNWLDEQLVEKKNKKH